MTLINNLQQKQVSEQRRLPVDNVGSDAVVAISGEAVQFKYYSAGVLTTDAGEAAGTAIVAKLTNRNIKSALGDVTGTHLDTSLSFGVGTTLTDLRPYPALVGEKYDLESGEAKLNAIVAEFENGEYCIDHRTGAIYGIKADATAADTADYIIETTLTGSSPGVAANVNVNQWGGTGTTLGTKVAASSVPVTLASDQPVINVNDGGNTTVLSGSKSVATAGVAEALAASTAARAVIVQADTTNTGNVLVGNAGSQDVLLFPGDSISIDIDDLNKIYVDVTVNGESVNYFATV